MKINKIAVVTSGGDVPGLNAAIHAIVLTASRQNVSVLGINEGYEGLIDGNFRPLEVQAVRNIMEEGGTILRTSRCERFYQLKWRKRAFAQLKKAEVDGLIIIGGNGSIAGAATFVKEFNMPVIAIPKTIDNDICGTDYAIGFDTATNTIVEAIDKIKDTADATSRIFIVEVMGRKSGFLALHTGIAVGADVIVIPEVKPDLKKMLLHIDHNRRIGNRSMIIVITENALPGGGTGLKKIIDKKHPELESRITVLGHIQRGGRPSAYDRTLASLLGYQATMALLKGKKNLMPGMVKGKIKFTPLSAIAEKVHVIDEQWMQIAKEFSFV